jgi:glucose-1-phosphate thymidylyltransferase
MKGIVLAGGTGSRLWPVTKGVSKQLLPVYDKPLIHYPIATLMLAGIRDISVITTPGDRDAFESALGDGSNLGMHFEFLIQEEPKGLAQAFPIAEKHIAGDKCALILGDNLFHGVGLGRHLANFADIRGAQIFAYKVNDPERYGVVSFDAEGKAETLEEKPVNPKSSFAVPGLYFYDSQVFDIAREVKPSARGEVEITSVNKAYMNMNQLQVSILPGGTAWMDTGTFSSLHDAASYVRALQERQGNKIACLEEVAYRQEWISDLDLEKIIDGYRKTEYATYLTELLNHKL